MPQPFLDRRQPELDSVVFRGKPLALLERGAVAREDALQSPGHDGQSVVPGEATGIVANHQVKQVGGAAELALLQVAWRQRSCLP